MTIPRAESAVILRLVDMAISPLFNNVDKPFDLFIWASYVTPVADT
jgi:hypothetical protein